MPVALTAQAMQMPLLAFRSSSLFLLHKLEKEKLHLAQDARLHQRKLNLLKDF
jgi:hypothetical protein